MSEGPEVPKSPGWSQSANPPPGSPSAVPEPTSKRSRLRPIIILVVVVIAAGVWRTWDPGHAQTSASDVEYTVLDQVQGTSTGDFHDPSITTMSCLTPSSWKTGDTFTCKGYKASSSAVAGVYHGTVTVNASGAVSWAGTWTPSP